MIPEMNRIYVGNCLALLRSWPDTFAQTVVTSPPYWGLRDYGVAGQLGRESTPDAYVQKMVEVFREVRRVLRDDGTLWINLGSSFASASSDPSQSLSPSHGPAYGNGDKGRSNSTVTDYACSDLCDGCLTALYPSGSSGSNQSNRLAASLPSRTIRDNAPSDSVGGLPLASKLDVLGSTMRQSSTPHLAECFHCANCDVCLNVLASASRDSRLCVRKASRKKDNKRRVTADHNSCRDVSGMAWLNYTFKPKDMVPIPWMVAMALQSDGWYLRSDIIWSKPNPMPESVTDRPTKAHEYLFLLAKAERYYYDAEAIKERGISNRPDMAEKGIRTGLAYLQQGPLASNHKVQAVPAGWNTGPGRHDTIDGRYKHLPKGQENIRKVRDKQRGHSRRHEGFNDRWDAMSKTEQCSVMRNKRSVWTVATSPFPEAHFATFPPDLIKPCILAGSSGGGVVLDPFMGAGTTALVAAELGRNYIGIELNPSYVEIAERRIANEKAQVKIAI